MVYWRERNVVMNYHESIDHLKQFGLQILIIADKLYFEAPYFLGTTFTIIIRHEKPEGGYCHYLAGNKRHLNWLKNWINMEFK